MEVYTCYHAGLQLSVEPGRVRTYDFLFAKEGSLVSGVE